MASYNFWGTPRNSFMSDEPAELRYNFGNPQVPELKNLWDVSKIQAQLASNQAERRAADQELMNASELAKNHPATNAGIFLGNILGTAGAYALANSLPKWFSQKNETPQVNPMSQDAINNAAAKITGKTISQMASEAMNGYTPPQDYNFNLPDWRKNQSWQPQNLQNIYSQKYSLPNYSNQVSFENLTPVSQPFTKF